MKWSENQDDQTPLGIYGAQVRKKETGVHWE